MMGQYTNSIRPLYRYSAFGLRIDSEIRLPELLLSDDAGNADVIIRYGKVPDKIDLPLEEGYYYQAAGGQFLLRVADVAAYYVTNGAQIVVQPDKKENDHLSRLYLLGTVMGVLLMQRGIVPIHGSAVDINGCGVVFTGISGAGKSTMAAGLHRLGYSLLADDVSAVTCDRNGVYWIQPGYPQQKLCQASAALMGIDTAVLDRIDEDWDKYAVPVIEGFRKLPIPLTAIYEIMATPGADVSIVPLKGIMKFAAIKGNIYRTEFANSLGLKYKHFRYCGGLAKQTRVFRMTRPENNLSLDRQVEILVRHCMNFCSYGNNVLTGIGGKF